MITSKAKINFIGIFSQSSLRFLDIKKFPLEPTVCFVSQIAPFYGFLNIFIHFPQFVRGTSGGKFIAFFLHPARNEKVREIGHCILVVAFQVTRGSPKPSWAAETVVRLSTYVCKKLASVQNIRSFSNIPFVFFWKNRRKNQWAFLKHSIHQDDFWNLVWFRNFIWILVCAFEKRNTLWR